MVTAASAQSAPRTLDIGVQAPTLRNLTWLSGEPAAVEEGRVLVVEFWTTWCPVCRTSIPTLTKLQRKDETHVRVVGVASKRFDGKRERVESFLRAWGPRIGYAIAWDGDSTAAADWLDASGQRGVPVAFVVDPERRVAWIGTPGDGLTDVVTRVAAGTFDIRVARTVAGLQRDLSKATVRGDREAILDITERWIAVEPGRATPWIRRFKVLAEDVAGLDAAQECARAALAELAQTPSELARFANEGLFAAPDATACHELGLQAIGDAFEARRTDPQLAVAYFSALAATKHDAEAGRVAQRAVELTADDAAELANLALVFTDARYGKRFVSQALAALHRAGELEPDNHSLDRTEFDIQALVVRDDAAAKAVGVRLMQRAAHDDALLNEFAWTLLDSRSFRGRFDGLALQAAEIVHTLPNGSGWAYVDTLARAKYVNGFVDEALALQRQAVERCDVPMYLGDLRERLREYKKAAAEKRK